MMGDDLVQYVGIDCVIFEGFVMCVLWVYGLQIIVVVGGVVVVWWVWQGVVGCCVLLYVGVGIGIVFVVVQVSGYFQDLFDCGIVEVIVVQFGYDGIYVGVFVQGFVGDQDFIEQVGY